MRELLDSFSGIDKLAQVEPYQQITQWTCSAACLKAVLAHWGLNVPETVLTMLIGARRKRGAETTQIVNAAKKVGFEAFELSFDSLDHAKELTDKDVPIICDVQSFQYPGKGHYVVLTKIDNAVHLMDPNVQDNYRQLTHEEMDRRWYDYTMAPPHMLMRRWGVVVVPFSLNQPVR